MSRRLALLVCFVCLLSMLSACQDKHPSPSTAPVTQPIKLAVTAVTREMVPEYYHASGYTYQADNFVVSTSQTATITALKVDAGDEVHPGDLLLTLDDAELTTALDQARASIQTARIKLKDSQYNFDNNTRLNAAKVIPVELLRKAKVELDIAQSQLAQAESEVERLESRAPYFRITCPIHARVSKRWAQQGDLAQPGKPLLQLEAIDGIAFELAVLTQWLDKIHLGDTYTVLLHARPDHPIQGKVSHIVQSTNRTTQSNPVRLTLASSDQASDQALSVGMSGRVSIEIGQTSLLLIPESALVSRAGVRGVFRLDESSQARFTPVAIERAWQNERVILAGLNEGDRVVLAAPDTLLDGQAVTP